MYFCDFLNYKKVGQDNIKDNVKDNTKDNVKTGNIKQGQREKVNNIL